MHSALSALRRIVLFCTLPLLLGLAVSQVQAAPAPSSKKTDLLYIKPSLEVLMRKNPAGNSRIIATLPMGTAVRLLKGGKDWSQIQLQNGTKGWVRSQFLGRSPEIPVARFRAGMNPDGTVNDPQMRLFNIVEETEQLRKKLAVCATDLSTLNDKYQKLNDPGNEDHAKRALAEAHEQIKELQQRLTSAEIECEVLKKNRSIMWFFTGSLVLLVGWIIGRVSGNRRRSHSSLLQ
ncbi:MAG: TIGR04211 family SH3 domain-containing protein [Desulfobulbus sp.]